ncbi:hypothetical protein VCHA53O466_40064 [Vibrio chagasii]|nr:hypothetical protein VCHA53O466_40064 [Vibrio chagasii]
MNIQNGCTMDTSMSIEIAHQQGCLTWLLFVYITTHCGTITPNHT